MKQSVILSVFLAMLIALIMAPNFSYAGGACALSHGGDKSGGGSSASSEASGSSVGESSEGDGESSAESSDSGDSEF